MNAIQEAFRKAVQDAGNKSLPKQQLRVLFTVSQSIYAQGDTRRVQAAARLLGR